MYARLASPAVPATGVRTKRSAAHAAQLTKSRGVAGTLSKLRRVRGGFYQVMLNGQPLYRFAADKGKRGSALGQGIKSFGGTWHVIPGR